MEQIIESKTSYILRLCKYNLFFLIYLIPYISFLFLFFALTPYKIKNFLFVVSLLVSPFQGRYLQMRRHVDEIMKLSNMMKMG
jgi:hypothetical protein